MYFKRKKFSKEAYIYALKQARSWYKNIEHINDIDELKEIPTNREVKKLNLRKNATLNSTIKKLEPIRAKKAEKKFQILREQIEDNERSLTELRAFCEKNNIDGVPFYKIREFGTSANKKQGRSGGGGIHFDLVKKNNQRCQFTLTDHDTIDGFGEKRTTYSIDELTRAIIDGYQS